MLIENEICTEKGEEYTFKGFPMSKSCPFHNRAKALFYQTIIN